MVKRTFSVFFLFIIIVALSLGLFGCGGGGSSGTIAVEREFIPFSFPFSTPADVVGLASFGIPNWSGTEPHNGIDLIIDGNLTSAEVVAPSAGTISTIESRLNTYATPPTWMATIGITINSNWVLSMVLEADSSFEAMGIAQQNAIAVTVGQDVSRGDKLADLLVGEQGYHHLHYMALLNGTAVCAYKYSNQEAKSLFLDIVQNGTRNNIPDGNISYGDPD